MLLFHPLHYNEINLAYEAGLAPCYHHTSLFSKDLPAPSLFWLSYIILAGALGIEPKLTESKSVVLPLHNAPT